MVRARQRRIVTPHGFDDSVVIKPRASAAAADHARSGRRSSTTWLTAATVRLRLDAVRLGGGRPRTPRGQLEPLAAAVVLTVGTLALRQPLPTTLDEVRAASGDALLCPLGLGKGARFGLISRFAGSTTVVAVVVTSPAATKSERSFSPRRTGSSRSRPRRTR